MDIVLDDNPASRFQGATPEEVRVSLLELLERNQLKLSDVFREMDDDGSNLVGYIEFKRAFEEEYAAAAAGLRKHWPCPHVTLGPARLATRAPSGPCLCLPCPRPLVAALAARSERTSTRVSGFFAVSRRLHFHGPGSVLREIFDKLDGDASGSVAFPELQAWARGRQTKAAQRRAAMMNLSIANRVVEDEEAWDETRLHAELKNLLQTQGLMSTDLVRAWSGDDNIISKREFLQGMKKLIDNEKLWYTELRGAVTDAFETIDSADDGTVSIAELCAWLDSEDGRILQRHELEEA